MEGEERLHAIGYLDRILLVVHTVREEGLGAIIWIISARKATPAARKLYEETNEKPGRIVTRTIEQIENRKVTKAERERLKRLAGVPDDQIDTSDVPEVKDRAGWVRVHEHPEHPLHRVVSRRLSIRIPEPDITLAQRLAASRGLPYQMYIKSLLHERVRAEGERK